jgi:hypothetical protein
MGLIELRLLALGGLLAVGIAVSTLVLSMVTVSETASGTVYRQWLQM